MTENAKDHYQQYLDEIEHLLKSTPSYPDLLNRRGLLKLHFGKAAEAKQDFIAALGRNSRYEQARTNLAFTVVREDFRGALDLLATIAKASDDPTHRFVDMARMCYSYDHPTEAWDAIYHALDLSPHHPLPLHWGAYFLHVEERPREAKRWLLRAARAQGGCVEGYEKSEVKQQDDLDVSSLAAHIESVSSIPGFAEIHAEAARWLYMIGKEREAVIELQKILAHDPRYAPFATLRGWMEFVSGHHHRASRWLRKALECDPDHARAHEQLAHFYSANGEGIRSEHHLTRAVELRPGYPDLRFDLALHCIKTDRIEEAVSHLRSSLAIAPRFALARLRLGECLTNLGRYDAALEQFKLLPEEMQVTTEVHALMAACLSESADGTATPGSSTMHSPADAYDQVALSSDH